MIKRQIEGYHGPEIIACDGKCEKAWGICNRPKVQLDPENEDNYYFLPDQDLGIAPVDPGTEEGGHKKPVFLSDRLDDRCIKWCFRECERAGHFPVEGAFIFGSAEAQREDPFL